MATVNQRYHPSSRGWYEIFQRDTTKAVVGATTGILDRPQFLVLEHHDHHGRLLRAVGRKVPLRPDQGRQVAEYLTRGWPRSPYDRDPLFLAGGTAQVVADVPPQRV
ncbi:hypothetical protein ACWCQL_18810 [Streptomyces sp. NPDC002073]